MMSLRVVSEHAHTFQILELLKSHPGVVHVTRSQGIALEPLGDVIEALVAREIVQDVLDSLAPLGIEQHGEIALQSIDLLLSNTADKAAKSVPRADRNAVVWDELVETTGEDSELTPTFLALLIIGCLLAAIGVVTDSAVLIVGAMVVSPDFGPLAALAVAAVGKRRDLAARAGLALGVGFPVAILVTASLAILARTLGMLDPQPLAKLGAVAFVYQVGPYSVIVGVLAGAAGMIALTSQKSGPLVGVFISITTVPAAGFAALAGVTGEWARCGEAMLQLFLNLTGVVVAAIITLWLRRHRILLA